MILEYWNCVDMYLIRFILIFVCFKWCIVIDVVENKNNNENCLKDKVVIGELILLRFVFISILVRWLWMYVREYLVIENFLNVYFYGIC